jgi:hypothetical protein
MTSLRSIAAAGLCALAAGCSLLLDPPEPSQCSTNSDCQGMPSLAGRVCVAGFCSLPKLPDPGPVSNDAGDGCVSNQLCTQANSNKASVCKKAGGTCTPWQTEQCPFVSGAWSDPNAIIIGAILPLTTKQASGGFFQSPEAERSRRAIDLGLDELTIKIPQGLLVGNVRRPIAVLYCDSQFNPARTAEVMDHLTDVVGAQAIIVGTDEDLAALSAKATAKKTAIACSDCLAPLPQGPLAWRIVPPIALEAPMAAWRVASLEAAIMGGANPPAQLKVAVLAEPVLATQAFAQALFGRLRFNGKTVDANGSNFLSIKTADPRTESVNYKSYVDQLVALAPDVIVVSMGSDFPRFYLPLIEAGWPVGKAKPSYVLTDLDSEAGVYAAPIGTDEDLRKRLSGTRPAVDPALAANIAGYTLRYKQAYNFVSPDNNYAGYEAFYAMAYAIIAASTQPILDGPHISAGFESLVGGSSVDIGPGQVESSLVLLGNGSAIDVRGLWSSLDWNIKTRDLESDVGMFCFTREGGGLAMKDDAGPHLTTKTGLVTGTYTCD